MNWLRKILCGEQSSNFLEELENLARAYYSNDFKVLGKYDVISEFKNVINLRIYSSPKDSKYVVCPYNVLLAFNAVYRKYKMVYRKEVYDCDDFSIDYLAFLRRFSHSIKDMKYPFAIGIITGYFPWVKSFHQNNIILTDKGVYLIEPNSSKIRVPKGDNLKLIYL